LSTPTPVQKSHLVATLSVPQLGKKQFPGFLQKRVYENSGKLDWHESVPCPELPDRQGLTIQIFAQLSRWVGWRRR
jgi:hypothetical protein